MERKIANKFASFIQKWAETGHESLDRVQREFSHQTPAWDALDEAKLFVQEEGIALSTPPSWSELEKLSEFCERHPFPGANTHTGWRSYYLPRIHFAHFCQAQCYAHLLQILTNNRDGSPLGALDDLKAALFDLGALCREYQLSRDNAADTIKHKDTIERLSDRSHVGNKDRIEEADKWRFPARAEAKRRWELNEVLGAAQMARRIRPWLIEQPLGFDEVTAPKSDTIRRVIGDLRPKKK